MTTHQTYRRGRFEVSTDPNQISADFVHDWLSTESYWAENIPREVVDRALKHSLCFGLYDGARQIGLARVITDRATYAYLCDVFVHEVYRGQGLGQWLIECVLADPDLQGLRRFMLSTVSGHKLYERLGFSFAAKPENLMEIHCPNVYQKSDES